MKSGFRVGKIWKIEVRIDWSWLLILALISWSLGVSFVEAHPDWSPVLSWGLAIGSALLFFASLLAHELAHSLVARARGIPVRNITLFLFGGISNIQREPSSPTGEFQLAIVGPITSFVLGLLFLVVGIFSVGGGEVNLLAPAQAVSQISPWSTAFLWLGSVNVLVAFFNLIPGFPLDGGRVLRSLLWAVTEDVSKATRWATRVGQVVAWMFILAGVAMVFNVQVPILGSGLVGGIWLILIGWFLHSAALQSHRQTIVREILEDVPVRKMMRADAPAVPAYISVEKFVDEHLMKTDEQAFLVIDGKNLVGMVTLDDVRKLPSEARSHSQVKEIMIPSEKLIVIAPEEDAAVGLQRMRSQDLRQLPVVHGGQIVGMLRRKDIVRWLQIQVQGI
ncbi:MAG: site-2 protease family protein [Anaerolineales bacterium]|nr:site-2 protease family protein [Anaerolineales bacterium]